ncbi:MAG: SDR family NAD(P)-dependent oxidoreductase [Chthoniobacterales bacterium]
MRLEGCSALVTGASAGIGREFARQLAGRAGVIVLVARRRDRLEELRRELTQQDPNLNVHVRAADLSKTGQVAELCEWLEQEKIAIDLLINNAGLGDSGNFAASEPSRVEEMILVNVFSLTLLARRLLPSMIARRRGAILNVSSSASFLPMAQLAVYAATKAYVTSFSEALRSELRGTGVVVSALCPGPVHTEFTLVARRESGRETQTGPEFLHVAVEDVARAGLAVIERDKALVIPGFAMKAGMTLVRMSPLWVLRLATRFRKNAR